MEASVDVRDRLARYRPMRLEVDLGRLSEGERRMLPLLREATQAMELPFWLQEYGDPAPLLAVIEDPQARRYVQINFGPWDREHRNEPILAGVGPKPPGANYYPTDITQEEFEAAARTNPALKNPYTMVRRDPEGRLVVIPYHEFFRQHVELAAERLSQAAELAADPALRRFLELRAEALLTDDYRASDFAWMELGGSRLDLLIGPLEVDDRLFGIKTAYAGTLLVKEPQASAQLARYLDWLPRFQEALPLPEASRDQHPGLEADLGVYDALHFAGGDALYLPAGVAWPNDEEVQLRKGVRSLLLKNVIRAKFEALMLPLAEMLIAPEQRRQVHYQGRFDFILFHELAHGLGVKYTQTGETVREALMDLQHLVEEAKADLGGLLIATRLHEWGELSAGQLQTVYASALVSLFYNIEARQAVMQLNFFQEKGAYARDPRTGSYRVQAEKMPEAIHVLLESVLRWQAEGDYASARDFVERYAQPGAALRQDIERMEAARLPVGIVVEF